MLGVERWSRADRGWSPTRLRGRSRFLAYGQNCFDVAKARLRGRSRFLAYGQNCFGVAKARLRGRSRFLTYGQNCFGVAKARLRGRSRYLTYGQNCFGVAKARSGFAGWRTRWTYTPSGSARPLRVRRSRGPHEPGRLLPAAPH